MSKQIWHRCVKKRFSPSSNSKIIDPSLYFLLSSNNSSHHICWCRINEQLSSPQAKEEEVLSCLEIPAEMDFKITTGAWKSSWGEFSLHQFYLLFSAEHWVICLGLPWPSPGWRGWPDLSLSCCLHCPSWWPGPSAGASPPAASSSPAAAAPSFVSWLPEREGWKHKVQTTRVLLSWGKVIKETSRHQGSCQRTLLTIYQDFIPSCFGKSATCRQEMFVAEKSQLQQWQNAVSRSWF